MVSGCGFARMFICRQIRDLAGLEVTIHNRIISGISWRVLWGKHPIDGYASQ
jgi:hypothetical protein